MARVLTGRAMICQKSAATQEAKFPRFHQCRIPQKFFVNSWHLHPSLQICFFPLTRSILQTPFLLLPLHFWEAFQEQFDFKCSLQQPNTHFPTTSYAIDNDAPGIYESDHSFKKQSSKANKIKADSEVAFLGVRIKSKLLKIMLQSCQSVQISLEAQY